MRYAGRFRGDVRPGSGGPCPRCGLPVAPSTVGEVVTDPDDGTPWVRYRAACDHCGAALVRKARVRPATEPWRLAG